MHSYYNIPNCFTSLDSYNSSIFTFIKIYSRNYIALLIYIRNSKECLNPFILYKFFKYIVFKNRFIAIKYHLLSWFSTVIVNLLIIKLYQNIKYRENLITFCKVPGFCFRNTIMFPASLDFPPYLLPCILPSMCASWPFRCLLIRCSSMVH